MTTINQLRLKRRVVNSLPAAIATILLSYIFLGLFGPAQGGALPEGPGGLYLVGPEGRNGLVPAPSLGTEIAVDVAGIVSRVRVTQLFENPSARWVEGIYLFPLPDDAVVDGLFMRIDKRLIEGRIEEKARARDIYREAAEEGQRASLVETRRRNLFEAAIANIGPGERVAVTIEFQHMVRYDHGIFRLRLPLAITPRYGPDGAGSALLAALEGPEWPVADANASIDVAVRAPESGTANPVDITIDLAPGFVAADVGATYHRITVTEVPDAGRIHVALSADAIPADRDFELTWRPANATETHVATFVERLGDRDHLLLMITPPDPAAMAAEPRRREVVFVLDTSGSMAGASIAQAKDALAIALRHLNREDRFNLIRFDDTAERLFPRPQAAEPDLIEAAVTWLDRLDAGRGTEMMAALTLALGVEPAPRYLRQIVFITDGAVSNEAELLEEVAARLGESRLFTVGIGSAPNSYFMREAAKVGRGSHNFIGAAHEVAERMQAFLAKLAAPALEGIRVSWQGGGQVETLPRPVPDLYAGEPLLVLARSEALPTTVSVSATAGERAWNASLALGDAETMPGIARLWAGRKIEDLGAQHLVGTPREAIREAITTIALAYQVMSPYTSLVAVDATPARPEAEPLYERQVAGNLPHGMVAPEAEGADPARYVPGVVPAPQPVRLSLPQGATGAALSLLVGLALFAMGALLLIARRRRV
jgi:Ca-activated chloride channel family protein